MSGEQLFGTSAFEQIRGQIALPTDAPAKDWHPDLEARCRFCGFHAYEHDPFDMRCPDDEDEARIYEHESED